MFFISKSRSNKLEQAFNHGREFDKLLEKYNQLNDALSGFCPVREGTEKEDCSTLRELKNTYEKISDLITKYNLDSSEIKDIEKRYELVIRLSNRDVVGCG